MNPRIQALSDEFEKCRSSIHTIQSRAAAESRDLTDSEQGDVDQLFARAEQLRPTIEAEAEKVRSIDATADIFRKLGMTKPAEEKRRSEVAKSDNLPTVGEYVVQYNRARHLGDQDAAEFLRSFSSHDRAAAQQGLADNSGAVPQNILGDLIKFVDASRPALNSLTRKPMWIGDGRRPRVTQTTQVGVQSAEFAELSTRKMLITKDTLTRGTYGGYVEISEQDAEFTDPGMMQIIFEDLAEQYGVTTGDVVADALVAAATNTVELTGTAGAISTVTNAALITGLWSAASTVYTNCKKLPDTMWVSPNIWADLGQRVDTTGRPLFPSISPMNASGTTNGVISWDANPLGLKFVVDPNFASDTLILGRAQYGEVYEQIKGTAIGAFLPGTLSTQVGYRGYLATYFRAEGFAKVVNAA